MDKIDLQKEYPNLAKAIEEKDLDEIRYFVVVDENYEDIDDEEVDVFDPEDYNYLIYITERVQEALGEDGLKNLIEKLYNIKEFENFLDSEIDLYGAKANLEGSEVAKLVLKEIDTILGEKS